MITRYKIKKISPEEEILVLYLNMNEEFSAEWLTKLKNNNSIQEFVKNHHIIWNGTKILLIAGGISTILLNYNENENSISHINSEPKYVSAEVFKMNENNITEEIGTQEEKTEINDSSLSDSTQSSNNMEENKSSTNTIEKNTTSEQSNVIENTTETNDTLTVSVYRSTGYIDVVEINDYLIGVVAAEMPASFNLEALKVQSILARTYVMKALERGINVTDSVSTQRYIDKNEMMKMWGSSYTSYYEKIRRAVQETDNLVITYNNSLIDCVYHSTSNGQTEDSTNAWGNYYPYLVSVDSHWDKGVSSYFKSITIPKSEFLTKLNLTTDDYFITNIERNSSGRVASITIANKTYRGVDFRNLFGLRSADFDIYLLEDSVQFDTRGYGHGVGLSQYGANEMAKEGYNYINIIKHYYNGITIKQY